MDAVFYFSKERNGICIEKKKGKLYHDGWDFKIPSISLSGTWQCIGWLRLEIEMHLSICVFFLYWFVFFFLVLVCVSFWVPKFRLPNSNFTDLTLRQRLFTLLSPSLVYETFFSVSSLMKSLRRAAASLHLLSVSSFLTSAWPEPLSSCASHSPRRSRRNSTTSTKVTDVRDSTGFCSIFFLSSAVEIGPTPCLMLCFQNQRLLDWTWRRSHFSFSSLNLFCFLVLFLFWIWVQVYNPIFFGAEWWFALTVSDLLLLLFMHGFKFVSFWLVQIQPVSLTQPSHPLEPASHRSNPFPWHAEYVSEYDYSE